MSIYKFRVLVDTQEDVFKDVEIESNATFEDLHNTIINAFEFGGDQMASFYMSNDEWTKGEEIGLMDMSFGEEKGPPSMATSTLGDFITEKDQKILYVYDFLKMWIFYVELIDETEFKTGLVYPIVSLEIGENPSEEAKEMPDLFEGEEEAKAPSSDPKTDMESEIDAILNEYSEENSQEDGFESFDNIDDYDF